MVQQFKICGEENFDRIDELLNLVGLEGTGTKKVKKFSLGMKQKLAIAMMLVGNPELLILDEPINGLDPKGIIDLRNLILKLNKEYGTTFFISSHILEEMTKFCTDYIFINDGLIVKTMTNEELQNISQGFLNVEVSNINSLEDFLLKNNWNYIITGDNSARIYEDVTITDFVMQLNEFDCKLLRCSNEKINLEEFYLNLME